MNYDDNLEAWNEKLTVVQAWHSSLPKIPSPYGADNRNGYRLVPITSQQWLKALCFRELRKTVWLPGMDCKYTYSPQEKKLLRSVDSASGFDYERLAYVVAVNYIQAVRMGMQFTSRAISNSVLNYIVRHTDCPEALQKTLGLYLGWIAELLADELWSTPESALKELVGGKALDVKDLQRRRKRIRDCFMVITDDMSRDEQVAKIAEVVDRPEYAGLPGLDSVLEAMRKYKYRPFDGVKNQRPQLKSPKKPELKSPKKEKQAERAGRIAELVEKAHSVGVALRKALGEKDYRWYKRNKNLFLNGKIDQ